MTKIPRLALASFTPCLGSVLLLVASCASPTTGTPLSGSGGSETGTGGTNAAGGADGTGGTTASGASGGNHGSGGSIASGGSTGSGGANTTGGHGGSNPTGGSTGSGGMPVTGAAGAAGVDQGGIAMAKACDTVMTSGGYLNLGDMRLINNRWGSDAVHCTGTQQKVLVACDGTLEWDFNRPTCGGSRADPDYPEVEFGVAPFGAHSSLLTSPAYSSTTLLPIQLSSLNSASVTLDNFSTSFTNPSYWDSNFEFWISRQNPLTATGDPGVYAEIIIFLGWEANRNNSSAGGWTCDKSGTVSAGGTTYSLCHQSDSWSSGHWRFFNFNVNNGPLSNFNGKGDVKAILDWVRNAYSGFTSDMWLTRIEVGTEIDDNTAGNGKIKNVSFEINGTTKTMQLAH